MGLSELVVPTVLVYARRGWPVIALHGVTAEGQCTCGRPDCGSPGKHPVTRHGCKDATTDEETIRRWWRDWPWANVGIRTGAVSGLVVLDVDPRHGGEESLRRLEERHGPLPPTLSAASGGGGRHLFFRCPEGGMRNSAGRLGPGLDVRGDDGYIVAFPSRHSSGGQYVWDARLDDPPAAEMPAWLPAQTRTRSEPQPKDHPLQPGQRNDMLFREACALRRRGFSPEAIAQAVQALNTGAPQPLPEEEVERIVMNALRYPSREQLQLTALGDAERLVAAHGERLRYDTAAGVWCLWDGRRWVHDCTHEVWKLAHATARELLAFAEACDDAEERTALLRRNRVAESEPGTRGILAQARAYLAVPPGAFDRDVWLFNCANGAIDLRTGALRPHERHDLLKRLSPIPYDPTASCSRWERFLREVFHGDEALCAFVQRAVGYSLTGDNREQCLFFLYGTGSNGKSTFIETLLALFGDYAQKAPAEMFLAKQTGGGVPNDIARLCGARLVASAELDHSRRFAESLLKDLTGGDTITARFLHREFFDFTPTHTLWLYGNHKPGVRGTDDGIWRRIRLIPFTVQFTPEQQDRTVKETLQQELPGILAWAVRGCLAWQQDGLTPPAAVQHATADYRAEMDTLAHFFDEYCVVESEAVVKANELYQSYVHWCEATGEHARSQRAFGTMLTERGIEKIRRHPGGYWYHGIALAAYAAA